MTYQKPTRKQIKAFQQAIYSYFEQNKRPMPWRDTFDPYCIFVSEIMLQQTQVERVLQKYPPFIERFPSFQALSLSSLKDVLGLWQGLGYNRRAMNLLQTALKIVTDYNGQLPDSMEDLITLPGIGHATAGAIMAFAFNKPVLFIETNIRRVFIHFFFQDRSDVHDREIQPLVSQALDRINPRRWYYALMDYGAMLKKQGSNPNRKSAHYTRQAPFEGSDRQVRGAIIRHLLSQGAMEEEALMTLVKIEPRHAGKIISSLEKEGFITRSGSTILIK